MNEAVDFYVTQLLHRESDWLIYRGYPSPERCVGVCASREDAIERAAKMARYHVESGRCSQVHAREPHAERRWRTVWRADSDPPRFDA